MWSKVIYKGEDLTLQETLSQAELSPESFTNHLARGLYNDIKLLSKTLWSSEDGSHEFNNLPENEKSFWYNYAAGIPGKLSKLNLFIRPFADFCRTCIITDKEIETLVQTDLDRYCKTADKFVPGGNENERERDLQSTERPVYNPDSDWKRLYIELNCLIPVQLKKAGYEIVRHEEVVEINMPMIRKLARAIHSRYLNEIRSRSSESDVEENKYFFFTPGDSSRRSVSDFDELPDEIKYSNIDNAVHIPTKLLAIGFKIRPVKKGFKSVTLHLKDDEIEAMAKIEHIRWSWEKRLAGWIYDTFKDDSRKTHPSLVPYEELSEQEKEKDRKLVKLIPALLQDIDYEAYPVSPNRIKKLSYAIKSQGLIQKILDETRELNEQIRTRAELTPEIEAIVGIRNKKIEEAIREIEGSYRYAQHIQETFLPDDLYVRECFPESFILFKPKDLISGDFYFFSRQDDLIIFAAADCTGHGIPGALLSTLGYGILDQAVNEIKLKDPKYILYHLYSKIHRYLRNDSEEIIMADDMDIILCIYHTRSNMLEYSSVKNPLYLITKGELIEYKANNSSDNCNAYGECQFSSDTIQLNPGDTIYLSSDGYIDQFGGSHHKKFLSTRFKSLLQNISDYPMPEQSDLLYEETELWRDENREDQTDDILVIGIRL